MNSLKIHEENTKKMTAVSVVLYVIKFHVNLHTGPRPEKFGGPGQNLTWALEILSCSSTKR